jgi:hypothetical protein
MALSLLIAQAEAATNGNGNLVFGTLTPLETGCLLVISSLSGVVAHLFVKNQSLNKSLNDTTKTSGEEKLELALRLQPVAERGLDIIDKHNQLEQQRLAEEEARRKLEAEIRARSTD